ncbi:hypothetical protein [Spirillospora sp. CA-294931]|uniref:hypothetical protein n=1 Tax=Spirillospora sp. CA-294931 TaxID=3240042 RepID=UPI003D9183CA
MAAWARLGTWPRRWIAIATVVALALGVGGYLLFNRARPYLHGSSCEVRTSLGKMPLDLEQAANASTIAGVTYRKQLPERAAVIAYATVIQESHIRNLPGGDRDSVGMFQQRPSQGWGSPDKLRDPVQSTSKFYDALVKVKDYLDRDLHDAAQLVQRSADGRAYAQHEPDGKLLARAFTGREPSAVRCWFSPDKKTDPRRAVAIRELRRSFGSRLVQVDGPPAVMNGSATPTGESDAIRVSGPRSGWALASWAVTHAQVYGLTEVRFGGRRWTSEAGHDGWTKDAAASSERVVIR